MVKNEMSIIIHRPIDEVFSFVSDLQNGPQWQNGLFEVRRLTQGSLGTGSQFTAARMFLGRKLEAVVEVVTYEPNKKVSVKSDSGSVPFEESFVFEPTTEGTRLTTIIELHTTGFMGLAAPMIKGSLKRDMESDFGNLKDLLEQQVTIASS